MPNTTILIIEDDKSVIKAIQKGLKLENNNYKIITAHNGKSGLKLYNKEKPVLILLDLHMPVMGGITFLESIKLSPSDPCGVIVLTGRSDDGNIKTCLDLGVSAFLRKPLNMYELSGLVRQVTEYKKMQSALLKQCTGRRGARQFLDEKNKFLSAIMHKVKKPLIPIVNCTRDLLEGKIISENDRIHKLKTIQDASKELVDVFENPHDIAD